ncbi:hypothetical protein X975_14520, partial [Stegodyphus mimosarum]
MNFSALLSFETLNNSIARFSYGAKPQTSRTMSLMKRVCFVKTPFLLDGLCFTTFFVTLWPLFKPTHISLWTPIPLNSIKETQNLHSPRRCVELLSCWSFQTAKLFCYVYSSL